MATSQSTPQSSPTATSSVTNTAPAISTTGTAAILLDNMTTGIIALDSGLKITLLNASAEQLLGVSATRAAGRRLAQVVSIPDSLFARLREALEQGQPVNDRHVTLERIGLDPVLVDCAIAPYVNEFGDEGVLIEVNALNRTQRIVRDEALAAQQESVKSLLRGLAHEVKNPLGGLRGAAQLLERQLDDKELVEYTSIIIHEADRLQALIDRLLGPNSRPRREEINIHEVLEHVRKILLVSATNGITIQFDYDPSIPEFLSDRDRLIQVFLNIAGNALNAVKNGGDVIFKTRIVTNHTIAGTLQPLAIKVSINDNGPGVPTNLIDQIFYPMVSGTADGSGLGLSIAQSIMGQLGGLIECESEPGNTQFTVFIPVVFT